MVEVPTVIVVEATAGVVAVINQYDIRWYSTDIQYLMLMLRRANFGNESIQLKTNVVVVEKTRYFKPSAEDAKYNLTFPYEARNIVRPKEKPLDADELLYIFNLLIKTEASIRQQIMLKKEKKNSVKLTSIKEELVQELLVLGSTKFLRDALYVIRQEVLEAKKLENFIPDMDETVYLDNIVKSVRPLDRSLVPDPVNHVRTCSCDCWKDTVLNP
jgi:hypothetical protein